MKYAIIKVQVLTLMALGFNVVAHAKSPTCRAEQGSIAQMVCKDEAMMRLDKKLNRVYASALKKAQNEHPFTLKAEQRGWIKGRDDCWKSDNQRACVKNEYVRRIAELQARYALVSKLGPFVFDCGQRDEVTVTYFKTEPGTLIAERGDSMSLMYQEISASGARYQGRNESFWEHQGEALITWGYGAEEKTCKFKS